MSKDKKGNGDSKAPEAEKKAVAIPAGGALSAELASLADESGQGSEAVAVRDTAIPIISILQSNSPQCKKSSDKHVVGAEEGMFWNNVSESVEGKELKLVNCYYEKVFIEWKPRDSGGGFVAIHPLDATTDDGKGNKVLLSSTIKMVANKDGKLEPKIGNGNILQETAQHYVLILREGRFTPAVLSMASSALAADRKWNTLIKEYLTHNGKPFEPPRWAFVWKLTTKSRTKNNNSWFTWGVEKLDYASADIKKIAKEFYQAIKSGAITVKQELVDDDAPAHVAATQDGEEEIDISQQRAQAKAAAQGKGSH